MVWQASTETFLSQSSSSMGTGTALVRSMGTLSSGKTVTSFQVSYELGWGAAAGTYNNFTAGTFAVASLWQVALSWVPSGDSVPTLIGNEDDPHFLWVDYPVQPYDRNTINTAGGPTYKDLYTWGGQFKGRVQIPNPGGGGFNWHIANESAVTAVTGWAAKMRVTYS